MMFKMLLLPETLETHIVVRGITKHGVPFIKFFYLSSDKEPHFTQWYGAECDNNVGFCLRTYHDSSNEEWMECPLCKKWFHEECFFVE